MNSGPLTAGLSAVPYHPGRAGSVAGLGSQAGRVVRGRNNLDVSIDQYLLNSGTDLSEHVRQKFLAYGAQLQVLGILAGVLGTEQQQAEYREAVKNAAGSYFTGLLDRARRQSVLEGMGPLDMASNAVGLLYKGSAALAGAAGWERGRQIYDDIGNRALATDPDRLLFEGGKDLINSIIESCKARWDQFWTDLERDGLLVAYGKLQIDGAFLAAEVAIDVALAAITGGIAGAASAGIKIVGRRISATVTQVTIRAANRAARGVPESGVLKVVSIPDAQIDGRIRQAVLNEELLGTISRRQDMARRGQQPNPQVERPQGVSREDYGRLRSRTPSERIRRQVRSQYPNATPDAPVSDEWLPGLQRTAPVEADHIVSMREITEMDGFSSLSQADQVAVLNMPENFTGLSRSANASKGDLTFEQWRMHKASGTPVDPELRRTFMQREIEMRERIQAEIRRRRAEQDASGPSVPFRDQ